MLVKPLPLGVDLTLLPLALLLPGSSLLRRLLAPATAASLLGFVNLLVCLDHAHGVRHFLRIVEDVWRGFANLALHEDGIDHQIHGDLHRIVVIRQRGAVRERDLLRLHQVEGEVAMVEDTMQHLVTKHEYPLR
jgi:hypothetical protein